MAKSRPIPRAMLGAIAIAPFAIHAPAVAAEPSRHAVWLAEHASAQAAADQLGDVAGRAYYDRLTELERLLTTTSATNLTEAKDRLRYVRALDDLGMCLDRDAAADLMLDVSRFFL